MKPPLFLLAGFFFLTNSGLHPLQPGAMRGDGTLGLKKQFPSSKYTDWSERADIKAELKVDLILLLGKHGYPPVDKDEVYKEIFEQAENFKKYQGA
jgi:hypothetical protein